MKTNKWLLKKCDDLTNKTVIVTGATGVIGENIIIHLLKLNAKVIMAIRNIEQGEILKKKLLGIFPNSKIDIFKLDLSSLKSIENFINKIKKENLEINHLINNAGAFKLKTKITEDNFEIHYATNYIGPVYLSLLILPILNRSAGSNIIFQSSLSYKFYNIDWEDIQSIKVNNSLKTYARSKRMLTLTIETLRECIENKYKNISLKLCHPGVCSTNIIHYKNGGFSKWFYHLAKFVLKFITHSPKTASLTAVYSLNNNIAGTEFIVPRGLFQIWGKPKISKLNRKNLSCESYQNIITTFNSDFNDYEI